MSAIGFTPIQLFRTTTAAAVPSAGNLAAGELAINLTDERLYFKNAAGVVKLLASNTGALGTVTSVAASGGTTGLTFSGSPVTSSGTLTLGGTLAVANGGTGVTTSTGTGSVVLSTSPTLTTPNLGTPSAATLTNATGLPIVAGTTGTLSVARGGTGVTTSTGTGNVVLSTSPVMTTPNLGTPSAATLTNATGLPIVAGTTGTLSVARGGTGATDAAGARTNLGATTVGGNLFTLANPSAITFPRFNADNTVSALSAADFRTAIGAGTSSTTGTVTSVSGAGSVNGITLTGTVTSSGSITLGGALTGVNLTSQVTGTLPVANGGTGQTSYTDGQLLIGNTATGSLSRTTLTAGSGIAITNGNGSITITSTAAGGTVTSVAASGGTTGLTFSGSPITTSGTLTLGGTLAVANGGTGVTTSTGTGSVVLSNSPTLVTPTLGAASATSIANGLGAVGTPSYTFTGDTNTGMWSPSADAIAFSTAGSERVRVNSSGNVGIGTSSPSRRLTVSAAGTDARINIVDSDTAFATATALTEYWGSDGRGAFTGLNGGAFSIFSDVGLPINLFTAGIERMRITAAGSVGIGTSAPSATLAIVGTSNPAVNVDYAEEGAGGAAYRARKSRGTAAAPTAVASGDFLSSLLASGYGDTGFGGNVGLIGFRASQNFTDAARGTNIVFENTPDGSNSRSERMRITSAGNVGIGTTNPATLLSVQETNEFSLGFSARTSSTQTPVLNHPVMVLANTNTGAGNGLNLRYQIADTGGVLRTAGGVGTVATAKDASSVTADMYFYVGASERMRITSAGNLGLGTSAPGALLDAQQSANASVLVRAVNANAGASADARLLVSNGTTQSGLIMRGTGHPSANELVVFQQSATAPMTFFANGSERMRITAAGSVGIGTSAPATRLEVMGAQSAEVARIGSTISDRSLRISNFAVDGVNQVGYDFNAPGHVSATPRAALSFSTLSVERMRILDNGFVGIGTTAPATALDVNGTITATSIRQGATIAETGTIAANSIGFRGIPQNAQTAAYILALSDQGRHISITTGGVTIPANASVAFPIGAAVTIYNNSASGQTIAITTDTLRLAGTATTGSRTLAQRGICTVVKVTATEWVISGAGLS